MYVAVSIDSLFPGSPAADRPTRRPPRFGSTTPPPPPPPPHAPAGRTSHRGSVDVDQGPCRRPLPAGSGHGRVQIQANCWVWPTAQSRGRRDTQPLTHRSQTVLVSHHVWFAGNHTVPVHSQHILSLVRSVAHLRFIVLQPLSTQAGRVTWAPCLVTGVAQGVLSPGADAHAVQNNECVAEP